jgi:hypothetical protein
VISFLFNWPSTGGGNMHTAGLVEFLGRDGYEVRHFFARSPDRGIGRVTDDGLVASEAIEFAESEWNVQSIKERFRAAVDSFALDYVVISDTWNMKPHLLPRPGVRRNENTRLCSPFREPGVYTISRD